MVSDFDKKCRKITNKYMIHSQTCSLLAVLRIQLGTYIINKFYFICGFVDGATSSIYCLCLTTECVPFMTQG